MPQLPERAPLDVYGLTHTDLWQATTNMLPSLPGLPPYIKRVNMSYKSNMATFYADIEWVNEAEDVRVESPNLFYSKHPEVIEEAYENTLKAMNEPVKTAGPYQYEFAEQQPPISDVPEQREALHGLMPHTERLIVSCGGLRTLAVRETLEAFVRTDAKQVIAPQLADIALMFARYTGGDEEFFAEVKRFYRKPVKERRQILYASGELPLWLTGRWSERTLTRDIDKPFP